MNERACLELLPLDDPRWAMYCGGYNRAPYDVVSLIRQLHREGTSERFWELVWDELHHQGDVGEASYALVPYLVEHQSRQPEPEEQVFHYCVVVDLAQPEKIPDPTRARVLLFEGTAQASSNRSRFASEGIYRGSRYGCRRRYRPCGWPPRASARLHRI